MNRIETRIIVMVTNRLAAARDSEAKDELIEELSENLYQRYQDLTAEGVPESEALQQAMDSLGDTDELIAYLRSIDAEGYDGGEERAGAAWEDASWEEHDGGAGEGTSGKKKPSFFGKDLESGIEDIVNAAVSAAKSATAYARDAARDMSEQLKEKYPDGFTWQFSDGKSDRVETVSFPSEGIRSLDVRLINASVNVYLSEDPDAAIEVAGDMEYINTLVSGDGVLSVSQENTASSSALFNRGVMTMASDVEIILPGRAWDAINLATVSGDIWIEAGLQCQTVTCKSQSGDISLAEADTSLVKLHSNSGDITGITLRGEVQAATKSGDVDLSGSMDRCTASSISGDVSLAGSCSNISCTSTSGDVEVSLDTVPDQAKAASVSGDCTVRVPRDMGFCLSYHTTSGEFSTNLSLTGAYRGKRGELSYLDGGDRRIRISSVSGDLEVSGS